MKSTMFDFAINVLGVPLAHAQAGDKAPSAFNIVTYVLGMLPLWITSIVVFIASLAIAFAMKGLVESRLASKISAEEHQEVLIISGRVAFIIVSFIGITISLSIAGIDLTALLAAIGFGISFGMQNTISNFVAGLAILASRPFTIGDWINVEGKTGKVIDIRTRATYLQTFDGMRLIVPNAVLYSSSVVSMTSNPMRRVRVPIYCSYGSNLGDVMKMAMHVVQAEPRIFLEPKANIVLMEFGDYYVHLELRFWVDSKSLWRRIQSEIALEIERRLEESGCDAPYPVTSLSLEEDVEGAVLKTKGVDAVEYGKMVEDRAALEKQFAAKRAQYSAEQIKETQAQAVVDVMGVDYLKTIQAPATLPMAETKPIPPSIIQETPKETPPK